MLPSVIRHNRAFARLWGASAISNAGTLLTYLALPLVAFAETRSGATFAAVSAAELVGTIASMLVGGALADRLDRRRLMLIGDALLFAAAVGVGLAVHGQLWSLVVALALVQGTVGGLFAANGALLRDIVAEEDRTQANSLDQVSMNVVNLVVPLAGVGIFTAIGFTPIIIIDALTFAVSFALVWGVHDPAQRGSMRIGIGAAARTVLLDVGAGVALARRDRYLRWGVVSGGINGLGNGMLGIAVVPWLAEVRHLPTSAWGLIITGIGASGLAAAFVAARIGSRIAPVDMLRIGCAFACMGAVGFLGSQPLVVLALGVLCFGVGNVFVGIASATITQSRYPSDYQGRIGAMGRMCFFACNLIGVASTGLLVGRISPSWLVSGFALLLIASMALFLWALRFVDEPTGLAVERANVTDEELATSG
ncbi:MAG: major facilitator superfamily 1 [Thermoleophilia bacterium]|nr:major facilitator superfamily 1 [Thermoleophilia bacterium]